MPGLGKQAHMGRNLCVFILYYLFIVEQSALLSCNAYDFGVHYDEKILQ